jgi:amino-acid N-acetyltransferase
MPKKKAVSRAKASRGQTAGGAAVAIRPARRDDLAAAAELMVPFITRGELLRRSRRELARLLRHAFVAETAGRVAGFAALEVYSAKIAEIQCLSFEESAEPGEIVAQLVRRCVRRARRKGVLEVMAVVPESLEATLKDCGFDFSLPRHKRAMFIRPADAGAAAEAGLSSAAAEEATLRAATRRDVAAIGEFIAPFIARGELLPRTDAELVRLARHAFIAEAEGRMVGLAAMEIYSKKLSEIQCLSVAKGYRAQGIGRRLVALCVQCARERHITETMAISSREEFLQACGFSYCLPGPKTALFFKTRDR